MEDRELMARMEGYETRDPVLIGLLFEAAVEIRRLHDELGQAARMLKESMGLIRDMAKEVAHLQGVKVETVD